MKKIGILLIFSWVLSSNIFTQPTIAKFSYQINASTLILHDSSFSNSGVDFMKWDFGDGFKDILTNPTHVYSNPGNYAVCLIVISRDLTTDTTCIDIIIPLNISGTIYEVDKPSENSKVYLLYKDSTSAINIIDSLISTDGKYSFNAQKKGLYSLFAVPSAAADPIYHSTYYGNTVEIKYTTWLNLTNEAGSIDIHLLKNTKLSVISYKEHNISIYPNPVSDKLFISGTGEIECIEIIDNSGICKLKSIPSDNTAVLQMNEFSTGMYFVRIIEKNNQIIYKLIKQ